jgi:hypothetical protein
VAIVEAVRHTRDKTARCPSPLPERQDDYALSGVGPGGGWSAQAASRIQSPPQPRPVHDAPEPALLTAFELLERPRRYLRVCSVAAGGARAGLTRCDPRRTARPRSRPAQSRPYPPGQGGEQSSPAGPVTEGNGGLAVRGVLEAPDGPGLLCRRDRKRRFASDVREPD